MTNAKGDFTGLRVMVIDDDTLVRETIKNILKIKGIDVVEAEDGAKGIELYEQDRVPLVITDMLMPGKEGIETIAELRQLDPEVKIIAISGGGATNNMTFLELARKLGANDILGKPFKPKELLDKIAELL